MKLNCIIDNRGYKEKPKYMGAISQSIMSAKEQVISIQGLAGHIKLGRTYLAGHLISRNDGRVKANIKDINFFSLDVDNNYMENGEKVYTDYTHQHAIKLIYDLLKIKPMIMYETYSSRTGLNNQRFRLVYGIDEAIDHRSLELLQLYIVSKTGNMFDAACKEANRLFLATNKEVITYDDYIPLNSSFIDILIAEDDKKIQEKNKNKQEREKRKAELKSKGLANYTNDIVDELKSQDISDYLINQGYSDIEKYKDGYKMACPIHHGTNKNFHINQVSGAWLWTCFSKCSGDGGSIIDLHMKLNNLDTGQAIKELCEIYNIKPLEGRLKASINYQIENYISEDKEAVKGIMQAIKGNKKTLLTGSMGSGKTHFVFNDLYNYSKEIDKTLIVVIPGVKQLDNLYLNKGISTVCNGEDYIVGTDRVATTPESLPKVTKELYPDSYILVVDESHERYTSLYRTGYKNKNIERAEKNAYKSIHLTATPRLLKHDYFDEIINIETKIAISNKITIMQVKDKLEDNMLSMVKTLIKNNMKPILFNNNKETNELFARELEVKEKITFAEFKEGQINIIEGDKPVIKNMDKIIVDTETISSGKKSINIAKGQVKADLTCTTSAVMAGIDLYTDDKAILIVNTRGLAFDNLIQLIGRFREGIDVILIVKDLEDKKENFDLEYRINYKIKCSQALAAQANKDKLINDLLDDGLKKAARLEKDKDQWVVNETEIVAASYYDWSETVFQDIDKIKELLAEQNAFKVESVRVAKFNDETETTMSDLKKLSRAERKERIKEITSEMLTLTDQALDKVLCKEWDNMDQDEAEIYKEYFKLAEKHTEKINHMIDKLFTDDKGLTYDVEAFRYFYTNSWASIEREIQEKQAREVNKLIKEHGTEFYLTKEASRFKTSIDVVQAKIRHELNDLEKKQGRLSIKRISQLVATLVNEGYIYNKYTKLLQGEPDDRDKEKALKCLTDIVRARVGDIYNFDSSGKLQSPKI